MSSNKLRDFLALPCEIDKFPNSHFNSFGIFGLLLQTTLLWVQKERRNAVEIGLFKKKRRYKAD